jgi:hypothetical protein
MTEPLLALRSIHKAYGRGQSRFEALAGVPLEIDAGASIPAEPHRRAPLRVTTRREGDRP